MYGWWWLRSPGNNQNNAANVNNDGSLNNNNVNNDSGCVRPVSPCLPAVCPCERQPVPWGEGIPFPFAGNPSASAAEPSEKHADGGRGRLTVQSGSTVNGLLREKPFDFVDMVVAPVLIGGKDTATLIDGQSLRAAGELSRLGVLRLINAAPLKDSCFRLC